MANGLRTKLFTDRAFYILIGSILTSVGVWTASPEDVAEIATIAANAAGAIALLIERYCSTTPKE